MEVEAAVVDSHQAAIVAVGDRVAAAVEAVFLVAEEALVVEVVAVGGDLILGQSINGLFFLISW